MPKKVLVANRGEIAVRILRACRELGLKTVSVYSDVDRSALHVRYADESYLIGPAPPRESYLSITRLIETAKRSGANAIHPGYGFLAENAEFARACCEAGLIFIGPRPEVIGLMGDKIAARQTMQAAGIPVAPGTAPGLGDEELEAAARRIGYPLLVKAAAGGGGKGMRIVHSAAELPAAIAAARREAEAAFGDGTIYLERIIKGARHIEFQILGDQHGNVIHLGDRECSIQRRYQKLVEEAPAIALDDALRQEMERVAVQVAREVGYTNAGTVEFLLDAQGNFYFLEMNTRLQVEHCVTEAVTGVDIVKEQLRIAAGRRLRLRQEDVRMRGWAIECRITAEDPYNNFRPSIGRITGLHEPAGPGVRVDSGVYEGVEISPYYDSLIGKLVSQGETRGEAILRMRRALEEYRIIGIKTTIPFHLELMNSARFIGGQFDTTFVEDGFALVEEKLEEQLKVAAIATTLLTHHRRNQAQATVPSGQQRMSDWKMFGRWQMLGRWRM
ncbi:MAG: acetyl-CoA carboxylase biotin carboxylase subunit [Chloroflexota bacterium]|nr:acetyl-CoA carboxylase biotin carboxylase subunit [Anaerolineae bacterium]